MMDRLFRVSGWDENSDVHAFCTDNRQRAEEMRRQMEEGMTRVQLICGYLLSQGRPGWQNLECYETAEEACQAARDMAQQSLREICVEDSDGQYVDWRK